MRFGEWCKDNPLIAGIAAVVIVLAISLGVRQYAVNLEVQITGADTKIATLLVSRNSKMPGVVALVERGAAQERATLIEYARARSGASLTDDVDEVRTDMTAGNYDAAYGKLGIIMESVPTLQSIEGYTLASTTLITCENQLQQARDNRTNLVTEYQGLIKGFPAALMLKITFYKINPDCATQLTYDSALTNAAPVTFDFSAIA